MRAEDIHAMATASSLTPIAERELVLATLFRSHHLALERFFRRAGHPPGESGDLVQEVFVRLAGCDLDALAARPGAMMYRTARFVSIDAMRQRRFHAQLGMGTWIDISRMEIGDGAPSQEQRLLWREAITAAVTAIRSLPPKGVQAYWMQRVGGLSYGEIAARQGVSLRTVENHIATTASRMRALLDYDMRQAA